MRGATAALVGTGGVAEVDRDDLAGAGDRVRHVGRLLASEHRSCVMYLKSYIILTSGGKDQIRTRTTTSHKELQ
ncbi:hypothetical protein GCM10027421_02400 [Microbacterium shaanxiense]